MFAPWFCNGVAARTGERWGSVGRGSECARSVEKVGEKMKHSIALALILLAATFAVGQKTSSGSSRAFSHGAQRHPQHQAWHEPRSIAPDNPRARITLLCSSQGSHALQVAHPRSTDHGGARVLSAEFMLEKNRVTNISFDLDTTHMGPKPLVFAFQKQFGAQAGNTELPVLCWQNPVSNLLVFAGGIPTIIDMSLAEGCARYANPVKHRVSEREAYRAAALTDRNPLTFSQSSWGKVLSR